MEDGVLGFKLEYPSLHRLRLMASYFSVCDTVRPCDQDETEVAYA